MAMDCSVDMPLSLTLVSEGLLPLIGYNNDWLRNTDTPMLCNIFKISPRIPLPWGYTTEEAGHFGFDRNVWDCGTVWLHSAVMDNGAQYPFLKHDLKSALRVLKHDTDAAQYSLLVNRNGMSYDPRCIGGAHQVLAESGRCFHLSVRRGAQPYTYILLAIDFGFISRQPPISLS